MSFFSSIFSPITSLFTPSGTNARNQQNKNQGNVAGIAGGVAGDAGKYWSDWLNTNRQYTPMLQGALRNIAQSTTQAGLRQQAIRGGNLARSQAMSQSVPLAYQTNPALAQAYRMSQIGRANDYQNQALQRSTSPQAQAQAFQQLLGALSQSQQYAYQPFQQAASVVYGQPQVQVGPGFMDYLSGGLGTILGGKSAQPKTNTVNGVQTVNGPVEGPNPYEWLSNVRWGA